MLNTRGSLAALFYSGYLSKQTYYTPYFSYIVTSELSQLLLIKGDPGLNHDGRRQSHYQLATAVTTRLSANFRHNYLIKPYKYSYAKYLFPKILIKKEGPHFTVKSDGESHRSKRID